MFTGVFKTHRSKICAASRRIATSLRWAPNYGETARLAPPKPFSQSRQSRKAQASRTKCVPAIFGLLTFYLETITFQAHSERIRHPFRTDSPPISYSARRAQPEKGPSRAHR